MNAQPTETDASQRSRAAHPHPHGSATPPRYEIVIDACCFLFMFVNMGITSTTFNMFQPYINALPTMNDTLGSLVVSTRMLFAFLSTFVAAAFYRKLDCRVGVTLACLMTAAGSVVFSFSTSFPLFVLGAICTGTAYGIGGTVAMTLVIGRWFTHNKATALGIASMGTGLAAIALPPVVTHLVETVSLRTAFLFEAALAAAIAVLIFALMRNRPTAGGAPAAEAPATAQACSPATGASATPQASSPAAGASAASSPAASSPSASSPAVGSPSASNPAPAPAPPRARATLSRTDLRLMQVAVFLLGGTSVGSNAYLSVLLKTGGFDAYLIAAALSLSGVCLMIFKLVAGIVLDKAGVRRGTTIFFVLFFVGQLLLCFTPFGFALIAFLGVFFSYAGQPISSIGVSSWALDFSDDASRAQTIKRFQLFFTAGTFLCCLFPGALYDTFGSYEITYVLFAIAIATSGAIVVRTYRKYKL